mgnify:CR=1 FL=1
MSELGKHEPSLSLETITAAIAGDSIAMTEVLKHYEKYIISLSLRTRYEDGYVSSVYLDEFLRRNLESTLIEKVMTFEFYL